MSSESGSGKSLVGHTISNYRVVRTLGKGGMGVVYLAKDVRLGREVALKVLPKELASDENRLKRFEREARAASVLKHENIAHIYDIGEVDGLHFIAMEYVEGEELASRLARGPLATTELVELATQIALALNEAHNRGIIHRDVKPANILVTERGQIKVLDFGLARLDHEGADTDNSQLATQTRTQEGVVMGTVRYMSPEQALGRETDSRTDLFSFGIVLYEMATGRQPFAGASATETIDQILHHDPETVDRDGGALPEPLARILRKCLEKDRKRRYQAAGELLSDLEAMKTTAVVSAESSSVVASSFGSRRGWLALVSVGALLAAAFIGAPYLTPSAEASIDTIAILPFANETGDPDVDYLSEGISENLINTLSQLPDIKVISRASAFPYKDRAADFHALGRELKVQAVLVGRIVQQGEQMSVSAELVDVRDSHQLWGAKYQRVRGDVLTIENDIAGSIAETLDRRLAGRGDDGLSARNSTNPEAHQLYLKARHFIVGSDEEMRKATDYFREAIALDPGYALAYAGLAEAYVLQAYHNTSHRENALVEARLALAKAQELNPNLAEAHTVAGMVKFYFDWNWQGAESDYLRAIELSPGSTVTHLEYTTYLQGMRRYDDAIAAARRAEELDPVSTLSIHELAFSYLCAHRYEEAEGQFLKALELHPTWMWGHVKLAMTYAHSERYEEALAEAEIGEGLLWEGGNPLAVSWLAFVEARAGQEGRARERLRGLTALAEDRYVDPMVISIIYAGLGETEPMLTLLEAAYKDRSPLLIYAKVIPDLFLVDMSAEPRFQALLDRMELD